MRAKYSKNQGDKNVNILGMLYIVDVRMIRAATGEKIKHKLLVVGGESSDVERKLRWIFDASLYKEFSIRSIEKVREKVHTITTVITHDSAPIGPYLKSGEGTEEVPQGKQMVEPYDPKLYAVGIATTMPAKDEEHAMRKVGHAIISSVAGIKSHGGARLSEDSVITIEEIPRSSGHAKPRDVSAEINRAQIVRG